MDEKRGKMASRELEANEERMEGRVGKVIFMKI